jgi:hypothetical protein
MFKNETNPNDTIYDTDIAIYDLEKNESYTLFRSPGIEEYYQVIAKGLLFII